MEIMNNSLSGGEHEVKFDAGNLPDGIYIIKFQTGNEIATKR
jgi:hypothetical protein